VVPGFALYSAFDKDSAVYFSLTMAAFLLVGMTGFLIKWTKFDKQEKINSFSGAKRYPLSRMIFDCWDWDNCKREDRENAVLALKRDLKIKINQVRIEAQLKKRSWLKSCGIWTLRLVSFLVSLAEIGAGFKLIIMTHSHEQTIVDSINDLHPQA